MGNTSMERRIAERQREARRSIGRELREARLTANLSMRQVSAAAGLHHSHLPRIEAGERWPSQEALVALATVMGFDTSIRLFQSNGPRIRDRIQALMIEALLAVLHQRWTARLEVAVYRPVRGVIDVVLRDRDTDDIVAGEATASCTPSSSSCDGQARRPTRSRPRNAGRGPTRWLTLVSDGCCCSVPASRCTPLSAPCRGRSRPLTPRRRSSRSRR